MISTNYEAVVSKWLDTDLSDPPYIAIAMVCNEHRELARRVNELEKTRRAYDAIVSKLGTGTT